MYDAMKILTDAGVILPDRITVSGFSDMSRIQGGMEAEMAIVRFQPEPPDKSGWTQPVIVYHRDIFSNGGTRHMLSELVKSIDEVKKRLA